MSMNKREEDELLNMDYEEGDVKKKPTSPARSQGSDRRSRSRSRSRSRDREPANEDKGSGEKGE